MRLVAQAGPGVDSPGRVIVAVNREFDRSGLLFLLRVVRKNCLRQPEIRRGLDELDLLGLFGRACRRGLHFELGQRAGSCLRTARAADWKIRIGQQFETERGDVLHVSLDGELGAQAGRRVAAREERAVRQRLILLPSGGDVVHRGTHDDPIGLAAHHAVFPGCHTLGPVRLALLEPGFDLANAGE